MSEALRIFIGYDSKEPVTFAVAMHSILTRASRPIGITPLVQDSLRNCRLYTRPRGPTEATEFSLTRFLCPYLCDYEGYSLFLDSDVLVRADILDLLLYPLMDPNRSVYVCQHDYVPKDLIKFEGHEQTRYPKKNWSSVMLFDNAKCTALTPEYVNSSTGLELHRFLWTTDDQIGPIPLTWNWLVGEYDHKRDAKILHFTRGTPCFQDYADCDHADEWWTEYRGMTMPALNTLATKEGVLSAGAMNS